MSAEGGDGRRDFFVSRTGADRAWAEWIAWQLEAAGYTTVVQDWDFAPGENFVGRMRQALAGLPPRPDESWTARAVACASAAAV